MQELADLDPLSGFGQLTHLVLQENPVCKKEVCIPTTVRSVEEAAADESTQHYRSWILWRCPTVRFLDYQKVKDAEREAAKELFGTIEAPTALASKVSRSFRSRDERSLTQTDLEHQVASYH